jgi:hypothetical protein
MSIVFHVKIKMKREVKLINTQTNIILFKIGLNNPVLN